MDVDVSGILVGGFSALILVIFLIQSIREAFNIESRFLPLVGLGVAIVLLLMAAYLPEKVVTALAAAIAIAAAASFTVRYVKNGEQKGESKRVNRARSPSVRVQRANNAPQRVSRSTRKNSTRPEYEE